MTSMFMTEMPAILILESPGLPPTGNRRYRCLVCTELFRISDTSYQTIKDLRREHRMYLVVCYGCHRELLPHLPSAQNFGTDMDTARQVLGYR